MNRLSKCYDWYHVYNDEVLRRITLHSYSNLRNVYEDLQVVRAIVCFFYLLFLAYCLFLFFSHGSPQPMQRVRIWIPKRLFSRNRRLTFNLFQTRNSYSTKDFWTSLNKKWKVFQRCKRLQYMSFPNSLRNFFLIQKEETRKRSILYFQT